MYPTYALSLKDLSTSYILNNNIQGTNQTNVVLKQNWDALKTESLFLRNRMREAEETVILEVAHQKLLQDDESYTYLLQEACQKEDINLIRKYIPKFSSEDKEEILTKKVSILYQKLAKSLAPKLSSTPVDLETYLHLKYKFDHALRILWQKGILPQLKPEGPRLINADEIRCWIINHADQLSHIQKVKLNYLDLKVIPPEITCLKGLQILDLSNNQIELIPEYLKELRGSLKRLKLYSNKIEIIPEFLYHFSYLEWFSFHANPIKSMPPGVNENTLAPDLGQKIWNFLTLQTLIFKC